MARIMARRPGRVTRRARTLVPAAILTTWCDSRDPSNVPDNILPPGVIVVGVATFRVLDR